MPPARSPLAQPPRLAVALAQADMVEARARAGKDYGTVLVPEGLLASVLEVRSLIKELNALDLAGASVCARARPWRLRAFFVVAVAVGAELRHLEWAMTPAFRDLT